MLRGSRLKVFSLVIATALLSAPGLRAQQAPGAVPAAPVPPQIAAAKKVFVANGSVDDMLVFQRNPDRPYNQFYAAMKAWGHYELVSNPADADLVLELRFTAPLWGSGEGVSSFAPQLRLTILDAKTHFMLWTLIEPVPEATLPKNFVKNFNQGMTNLVNDVARISGQPPAIPPQTKKQDAGNHGQPVPR
ncbi:MAG TPA: hypothetical protein VE825_12930 [Terriglobales bacterium]|jgi:hypothetical protein|nr:hypothetical protein [Terriglobales bacterium]